MKSSAISLLDLLELAARENGGASSVMQKTFDWRHSRGLEAGKWYLGFGLGLIGATVAVVAKSPLIVPTVALMASMAIATLLCAYGLLSIWRLRQLDRQFARMSSLLADLEELRPFLQLLRKEGIL
jgi:hypothetical protein